MQWKPRQHVFNSPFNSTEDATSCMCVIIGYSSVILNKHTQWTSDLKTLRFFFFLAAQIRLTKRARRPGWQSWATEPSCRERRREDFSCQTVQKTGINLCSAGRHGTHRHGNRPCATPPSISISTSSPSPPLPQPSLVSGRWHWFLLSVTAAVCELAPTGCWIFTTHHDIQGRRDTL